MKYNKSFRINTYFQNGYEDDAKFVEIDGQKFEADDKGEAKLDDKGEKIPFKASDPAPEAGEKSLEELAKDNPALQKLLDDKKKLEEDAKKAADEAKAKAEEDAAKNGEWQTLAEQRKAEADKLKGDLDKKDEILGKYVGSVKSILAEVMKTIPKEKQGLIPDNFSPREKLEYITKNAKLLGASVAGAGTGGVDPNEVEPPADEEGKLVAEIEELNKKENKTSSDHTKAFELAKKLKELRAAKK